MIVKEQCITQTKRNPEQQKFDSEKRKRKIIGLFNKALQDV